MKTRPLDQRIKRHYAEQGLDENKLALLVAQAALVKTGGKPAQRRWHLASVLAVVVLGFSAWWAWQPFYDQGAWPIRAAQEIALNHKKQLREEFVASDFNGLRDQMGKLDFTLAEPDRLRSLGLRVIGARYCSIQGHLAAQIQLSGAQGRRYTLYQTHVTDQVKPGFEQATTVEDIEIVQWREGALFFGLATTAERGR